jgi:C1A family cysteine protease
MPGKTERSLGGHAVTLVGFNDETKQFIVRNSWGTAWGQNGYFTLPYAYVLNSGLASDFWCIKTIPGGTK